VLTAYRKGYRVLDTGEVESPHGRILKPYPNPAGYLVFCIRLPKTRKCGRVKVHRLAAYQKFGTLLFENECVRHLDGNPANNRPENIELGTLQDNMMDVAKEIRNSRSLKGARCIMRSDWDAIDEDRSKGMSYNALAEKYGLSKGTLSYHYAKAKGPSKPRILNSQLNIQVATESTNLRQISRF
jgi:hypothetical protein